MTHYVVYIFLLVSHEEFSDVVPALTPTKCTRPCYKTNQSQALFLNKAKFNHFYDLLAAQCIAIAHPEVLIFSLLQPRSAPYLTSA